MYSVLQNKSKMQYKFDKFPYLIIDDALPIELYNKLNDDFPSYKKIIGQNDYKENFAYRYNAYNSLKDPEIVKEWKEFIRFHTSYEFIEEFLRDTCCQTNIKNIFFVTICWINCKSARNSFFENFIFPKVLHLSKRRNRFGHFRSTS